MLDQLDRESILDKSQIERLIRRGARYFAESLWEYWPSYGDNEIPEANISLHMARSFGDAGFASFAEVHSNGEGASIRLDYLAYHPQFNALFVAESKRLYNQAQLKLLLADTYRVVNFRPQEFKLYPAKIPNAQRYGAVLATTWEPEIVKWWTYHKIDSGSWAAGREVYNQFVGHEDNEKVKEALAGASWGSVELQGFGQGAPVEAKHHYLLYALFER